MPNTQSRSGFTLLEALISMAIFSVFLVYFLASFRQLFSAQDLSWDKVEASFFAQERMEVAYNLFQNQTNWQTYANSFQPQQSYRIDESGSVSLELGMDELNNKFSREIYINPVYRNTDLQIVGISDSNAKRDQQIMEVKSKVSWEAKGKIQVVEYVTYLTQSVPEKIF